MSIRLDPKISRALLFAGVFLAATAVHYLMRPSIAPVLNRDINARSAASLINTLTPDTKVHVDGYAIGMGQTFVRVSAGCDGLDSLLMILAAIAVYPMPLGRKLLGLGLATLLVYSLNVCRIAGLWYCLKYRPVWFDTAHQTVGQTVIIVACVLFFALWTGLFTGARPSHA
jgi:exosortase family protein XrtM